MHSIIKVNGKNVLMSNGICVSMESMHELSVKKQLASKAKGRVLVLGYSMGEIQRFLTDNKLVSSIVTIEKSKELIETVKNEFGEIIGTVIYADFFDLVTTDKFDTVIYNKVQNIEYERVFTYIKYKNKAKDMLNENGNFVIHGMEFFEYLIKRDNINQEDARYKAFDYIYKYYKDLKYENIMKMVFEYEIFKNLEKKQRLLDYGSGGLISSLFAAAQKTEEIICADNSEVIEEIKAFSEDRESIEWDEFPELIAILEDKETDEEYLQELEYDLKRKIKGVYPLEPFNSPPIKELKNQRFDMILSSYFFDECVSSQEEFDSALDNMLSLADENCILLMALAKNATYYNLGKNKYKAFSIDENMLNEVLGNKGVGNVEITTIDTLENGYDELMLISAINKPKENNESSCLKKAHEILRDLIDGDLSIKQDTEELIRRLDAIYVRGQKKYEYSDLKDIIQVRKTVIYQIKKNIKVGD